MLGRADWESRAQPANGLVWYTGFVTYRTVRNRFPGATPVLLSLIGTVLYCTYSNREANRHDTLHKTPRTR